MSPTPDSTLPDPQQIIADLRRELDECRVERDKAQRKLDERTTERDESLAREAAAAEVLQVINASPGDLAPVFEVILEKAHSLCGADYGSLLTYAGGRLWPIARHGGSERLAEALREGTRPWAGGGMDEIVRGAPFAHIHDMAELAKIAPDDASPRILVEIGGIRTQLVVPL